jgi:hypothetical protein
LSSFFAEKFGELKFVILHFYCPGNRKYMRKQNPTAIILLILSLTCLIFYFDVITPLGYCVGVGYFSCLILFLNIRKNLFTFLYAGVASFLTVMGLLLSAPGKAVMEDIFNRALVIIGLWFIATYMYIYKRSILRR